MSNICPTVVLHVIKILFLTVNNLLFQIILKWTLFIHYKNSILIIFLKTFYFQHKKISVYHWYKKMCNSWMKALVFWILHTLNGWCINNYFDKISMYNSTNRSSVNWVTWVHTYNKPNIFRSRLICLKPKSEHQKFTFNTTRIKKKF